MYAIIIKRFYNGPKTTSTLLLHGNGNPIHWRSHKDASDYIDTEEDDVYHLDRNEHSRPEYQITKVGSTRYCAAYKRTFGGAEYHDRTYPKCWLPAKAAGADGSLREVYPRVTHSAASDVRAWWPACPDYSPGDSLSPDAARSIPEEGNA